MASMDTNTIDEPNEYLLIGSLVLVVLILILLGYFAFTGVN